MWTWHSWPAAPQLRAGPAPPRALLSPVKLHTHVAISPPATPAKTTICGIKRLGRLIMNKVTIYKEPSSPWVSWTVLWGPLTSFLPHPTPPPKKRMSLAEPTPGGASCPHLATKPIPRPCPRHGLTGACTSGLLLQVTVKLPGSFQAIMLKP